MTGAERIEGLPVAVNKQWKKKNTFNLFDVLNGTAGTSNKTLNKNSFKKVAC